MIAALTAVDLHDDETGISSQEARRLSTFFREIGEEVVFDGHAVELDGPEGALGAAGTAYDLLSIALSSGAATAVAVSATRAFAQVLVALMQGRSARRIEIHRSDGSSVVLSGGIITEEAVRLALSPPSHAEDDT